MNTVLDAISTMEERKQSAGLYESEGMIDSIDQVRQIWMSLDIPIREVDEATRRVIGPLLLSISMGIQVGVEPVETMRALWTDAFAVGVLFERQRNGTI